MKRTGVRKQRSGVSRQWAVGSRQRPARICHLSFAICHLSFVLIFLWLAIPAFGEEIDRLLVAVNGRVVTEGDLRLAHNLNAILAPARNGAERSGEEELNRLIDLELMRQELTNFAAIKADESEIEPRMQDLRNKYAEIGGLPALLRDLGSISLSSALIAAKFVSSWRISSKSI